MLCSAESLTTWRAAVERGRQWLADQMDRSPPFGQSVIDVNWYGKTAWAFAGCADRVHAVRTLRRVQALLASDTLHEPHETNWTNAASYALGWLVVGARMAEAFETGRVLYAELRKYVCPRTGGLYSALANRSGERAFFDAAIQGAAIHSALAMGDLSAACRAGDLMIRFIHEQPDRSAGIYNYFHPDLGHLTDVCNDNIARRLFVPGRSRQPYANLGFVLQGLVRLTEATGRSDYAGAGAELLDWLLDDFGDDLLSHSQNHKVAHAAIMLWRQTGIESYRDTALRIAPRIAGNILPDGRAFADVSGDSIETQSFFFTVRTTCDSVLWLRQICDEIEAFEDA